MKRNDDISNGTLATLLIVAIVVSLGGTYVVLQRTPAVTGLFTGSNANGTVSFTQQGVLSIRLNDASTSFGNISSTGVSNCTVTSGGSGSESASGCLVNEASSREDPMFLENDGNVNASVSVNTTRGLNASGGVGGLESARNFYLGVYGQQRIKATESFGTPSGESGSCATGLASSYVTLANASDTRTTICTNLQFGDTADLLRIDYNLTISPDLLPGNQTENVTFWASLA